jgi:hypothetical protein
VRFRVEALYAELAVLQQLRSRAKMAMLREAQHDRAWVVLRTIPFHGPLRVALFLATMQTPWRFRTKRQLWAYAGLAVVTRASAEYEMQGVNRLLIFPTNDISNSPPRELSYSAGSGVAAGRSSPARRFSFRRWKIP